MEYLIIIIVGITIVVGNTIGVLIGLKIAKWITIRLGWREK